MNEDRSNQEQQVNIMTSLTPEEAVAIVKEAVNAFVGDGDGADLAVLDTYNSYILHRGS